MPESQEHALAPMVRRLSLREELSEADRDAILALPFRLRTLAAGQFIVWDGDRPQNSCLLISGYAYRHKDAGNGGRQVMSIHMKGDIVDLQNSLLGTADHNVQMLTTERRVPIPELGADLEEGVESLKPGFFFQSNTVTDCGLASSERLVMTSLSGSGLAPALSQICQSSSPCRKA